VIERGAKKLVVSAHPQNIGLGFPKNKQEIGLREKE